MPIYHFNRLTAKFFSKLPLRTVLIVPFVLQTVSVVGLVGYLSFKSGQESVEDVAHQLIEQVGERISDRLTDNNGLSAINTFLARLQFSASGQTFIMDRSGNLIATSTLETPLVTPAKKQPTPLLATNSKDARTRDIARQLANRFGNFRTLQTTEKFTLASKGDRQFVRVTPYRDIRGLDWLIVVVVPESDFMAPIQANTRNTLWLCAGTLPLAIAIGLLTSRWVTKPIMRLNTVAKNLAKGKWDQPLEITPLDEVGELANSFNLMAAQLQQALADQKSLNEALAQSESQLKQLIRTDDSLSYIQVRGQPLYDEKGQLIRLSGTVLDISDRQQAESALRESAQGEQAIARSIERIRQSLDIDTIFKTTTSELRQTLKCDRVGIYRFNPDWSGEFVAESMAPGWISLMQKPDDSNVPNTLVEDSHCTVKTMQAFAEPVQDTYLQRNQGGMYARGVPYRIIEDIYSAGLSPCYLELLKQFQARAYVIFPIFCGSQLWGLLASYQNSGPRTWREAEINIGLQISTQLGVALQQAQLLEATQQQSLQLQQAAWAAEAANVAKSTFLANMSHELRTPLNAILGFSQLMQRSTNLSREQQENIRIINRSGEHLLALINQILDLAKIEAGHITLNPTDFKLSSLLNEVEEMFQLQARDKQLQLIFECSRDIPEYVQTDQLKLRQVLINLISNAIKFTKKGGIAVRVSSVMEGKNQQLPISNYQLHFEIEDTGAGMAADELDKLFQAFVQTKTGTKSQQGTGLGLAISQQFVKLMGGLITVRSEEGRGTTFAFDIPVSAVDAPATQPVQPPRRVIALERNQPRYRILIVDDRSDNRQLLIKLLAVFDFELKEASNGLEAIEMWTSFEPHLIFMDMWMPVMDGQEATKRIKATVKGQATAIIAVSADNAEEARTVTVSDNCDDFIHKPFRDAEIFATLHKHLGVRYIYDEPESVLDSTQIEAPTPETVAALPADWLAALEKATIECDLELILIQIELIRERNDALASALAGLANEFQFNQILALIHPETK